MWLVKKFSYVVLIVLVLLCAACSGVGVISSADKQKVEQSIRDEYGYLVSSGRVRTSSYEIDQI